MIIKGFELNKIDKVNAKIFLIYGENEGLKNDILSKYFKEKFVGRIEMIEEDHIFLNYENFISGILNKSFFEEKKLTIISRTSEKSLKIIKDIVEKNFENDLFVINAPALDKKSKLRNFFEKEKNIVCIPVYPDEQKTLSLIANSFFREKKINISQESINLIVDRCSGDRQNLNNELDKILSFSLGKNKINIEDIFKLTNLAENFDVSELADNCLSKNIHKTIKIINENNYSSEDCILILRTLLLKSKRILKLKTNSENYKNIEDIISKCKPPIFWKDKEIVKKQLTSWSLSDIKKLIYRINDIELLIKKNSTNSINLLYDFILNTAKS